MSTAPTHEKKSKTKRSRGDEGDEGRAVTLFNCNCHTIESVIDQLMYALPCSFESARRYAYIAHTNGQAKVFTGKRKECEIVADKLAEIGLKVRIT